MTNEQISEFINTEFKSGLSREKIYNELLSKGLSIQDIEGGFATYNKTAPISEKSITEATLSFKSKMIKIHSIFQNILMIVFGLILTATNLHNLIVNPFSIGNLIFLAVGIFLLSKVFYGKILERKNNINTETKDTHK